MAKDLTTLFLAVWLVSFLLTGIADIVDGMLPEYVIAESLGSAILGFILSFATLLIKRSSKNRVQYALIAGVLGVALPALGSHFAERQTITKATTTIFQPDGCEFSVEFPGTPKIAEKVAVVGGQSLSFQEAISSLKTKRVFALTAY